ncbi:hypothetical protein BZG36_01948 [Bifiguratus adelaidae]|uniref:DIS3-like exonuclease 2 n=1 Tax=Bifiguratus adelaidae TaxID=1938954 RepID=A0A261Y3U1_9FUNG|nr:hypothetical protein BZG36_01948 [Bifiguratus adelaidae]
MSKRSHPRRYPPLSATFVHSATAEGEYHTPDRTTAPVAPATVTLTSSRQPTVHPLAFDTEQLDAQAQKEKTLEALDDVISLLKDVDVHDKALHVTTQAESPAANEGAIPQQHKHKYGLGFAPSKRRQPQGQTSEASTTTVTSNDETESAESAAQATSFFLDYMPDDEVQKQIKEGKLCIGRIRINKKNTSEAYAVCDALGADILILGFRKRNRALEGDKVAIRLTDLDKTLQMKEASDRKKFPRKPIVDQSLSQTLEESIAGNGLSTLSHIKYCGEVVAIIEKAQQHPYPGILVYQRPQGNKVKINTINPGSRSARDIYFKASDKRMPTMAISAASLNPDIIKDLSSLSQRLFLAEIRSWPANVEYPLGQIKQEIGLIGDLKAETLGILAENNVDDSDFSPAVLQCLPQTPWRIPQQQYKIRRDFRAGRIFTIDPETARDLDDAVSIKRVDGFWEVGVHIADVSHFVKEGSALDEAAERRATSTYMTEMVVPMLPRLLCEELCSLNPGVDRLTFSVVWKMSEDAEILDTWFGKSIIKSCAKLAYSHAQSVIEGGHIPSTVEITDHNVHDVESDILQLHAFAKTLRARRFENGALTMNNIKLSFNLDDNMHPEGVYVYRQQDANKLIEEFMLLANMSVANQISKYFPEIALLRRHSAPIQRRLDEFCDQAEKLGFDFDGTSAKTLQECFDNVDTPEVRMVLWLLATKPMVRATYFCTGIVEEKDWRHYALNVPKYTHFTSPIRRYADVIVHRQLEASLTHGNFKLDSLRVEAIAKQCNDRKEAAKNAQEQSGHLYLCVYLVRLEAEQGPVIREAIVIAVLDQAFDILVPEFGIEKRIHMDALSISRFTHDQAKCQLTLVWPTTRPQQDQTLQKLPQSSEMELSDTNNTSSDVNTNGDSSIRASMFDTYIVKQEIRVLARLMVTLKPNMARSPPIINASPVPPTFA